MTHDIWAQQYVGTSNAKGKIYHILRICVLTWQGLRRNKIPVQAAALTFYSLIGLGPLIALGIMISSFIMEQNVPMEDDGGAPRESIIIDAISNAIAFAAPQVALPTKGDGAKTTELAPEMTEMINQFMNAAQSGTVGVIGSLMLFVIGIQVLSSIEGSFNSLWGVAKGRKLGERIVVYWTLISLGAVSGAVALSLIALNTIVRFVEQLPFGVEALYVFTFISPIVTFIIFTLFLATFFRFIPNTTVDWKPAFTGAAVVVILLHLYNLLSFLYVQRVVDTRSLYGSVGILVVLMLGLYVFWLLILLGGQLTYAVQNADYLTNENAWQRTSERTREVVSLSILLLVSERFQSGQKPMQLSEFNEVLRVPSHILNSSINRLCELGYLHPINNKEVESERNRSYTPGRPIENLTLRQFKQDFECYGNTEGADLLASHNKAIASYLDGVISLQGCEAADWTIAKLLSEKSS